MTEQPDTFDDDLDDDLVDELDPVEPSDVDDVDEDEDDEREPIGLSFEWRGKEVSLLFADLGPGDDLAARREIKLPVTAFVGDFGSDSLVVLWWTARRKAGERKLTYKRAERQAGNLTSIGESLRVEPIFADPEEDRRPEG